MRKGASPIASFGKTLDMLDAILGEGEAQNINALARARGIPSATAHRQVRTLIEERYLLKLRSGRYVAGPRLRGLVRRIDEKQTLAAIAVESLQKLATEVGCVAQLGTLENDMVTYRAKAGRGANSLFTEVDKQLEAYCSGIGKMLLACLSDAEREAYLDNGPFPRLTAKTICDPAALANELSCTRERGYAIDDGEIADSLYCIAVPIRTPDGGVLAAISVSDPSGRRDNKSRLLEPLRKCAATIEALAF